MVKSKANVAKTLILDIETAPNVGYTWTKWQTNVIEFKQDWYILSIAWSWYGNPAVHALSLPDFKGYKPYSINDKALVEKIRDLFEEADIVVAHNGNSFDIPKIQARMLKWGLKPPSPVKQVDTKKMVKAKFALTSNSLKDIAIFLGVGKKMDPGSFQLWLDCMAGIQTAWNKMVRYNKQDVRVLYRIYERLLPWDELHPNVTLGSGIGFACPRCGSEAVERRGWTYLKSWRAQRWVCKDCGRWSKGPREKLPYGVLQ
jgi:DNA polymerase elongation subunit (family B)